MSPLWAGILEHWSVAAGAIGLAVEVGYVWLGRHLGGGARPTAGQQVWFALGMLTYLVAFASPLDYLGDRFLFSAHMVQHMLEVGVMVPLLLLGVPAEMMRWMLKWRPAISFIRVGAPPAVALIAFNLVFDGFHFPVLYDLTLTNAWFHVFEHLLFFLGAILLWWNILSPLSEFPKLAPGPRLLYLFFAFDGMMPPAILILMWNHPLYWPYQLAPRLLNWSVVTDQRAGSLIMLAFMTITYGWAAVVAFLHYDMKGWDE